MERFVVTRTRKGLWSVSHNRETFATYSTEVEALSVTFRRAAERKRAGFDVVVVLTQAETEPKPRPGLSRDRAGRVLPTSSQP